MRTSNFAKVTQNRIAGKISKIHVTGTINPLSWLNMSDRWGQKYVLSLSDWANYDF